MRLPWGALAINNNILVDADHCPFSVSARAKRYLISADPKHSDGKPFIAPEKIESLYIETHDNYPNIVKHARRIIEHVGQDPTQFKVR